MLQHSNRIRHESGNDYVTDLEEAEFEATHMRSAPPSRRKTSHLRGLKNLGKRPNGFGRERRHE